MDMINKWTPSKTGTALLKTDPLLHEGKNRPSATDPIDFEKALKEFENDREFLTEVLEEFIRTVGEQIPKIRQALASKDVDTLKQEAHSIKGRAANLTACELSQAAGVLEDIGKTVHFEDGPEAFEAFEQAYLGLKNYSPPTIIAR